VETITATSGSYQAGFGGGINLGSNGQLHIFLSDDHKRSTAVIARIMGGIGHRVAPAAKIIAIPATGTGGGNSQPIDITIASTQGDADLSTYAEKVLGVIQNTPGTANVNSSALQLAPQIDVTFDRDRARALDLDIGSAALAVRAAFGGTLATRLPRERSRKSAFGAKSPSGLLKFCWFKIRAHSQRVNSTEKLADASHATIDPIAYPASVGVPRVAKKRVTRIVEKQKRFAISVRSRD